MVVDDWMLETMQRVPEIDEIVRERYELWCLTHGKTLVGIHRTAGGDIPRDGLVAFDPRDLDDGELCRWDRE